MYERIGSGIMFLKLCIGRGSGKQEAGDVILRNDNAECDALVGGGVVTKAITRHKKTINTTGK